MIKAQTLHDYHHHVLKLINKRIEELTHQKKIEQEKYEWKRYYQIAEMIKILELIKEDIEWDWHCSNYSKTKDTE